MILGIVIKILSRPTQFSSIWMSFQSDLLACLINHCSAEAEAVGPTFIHQGAHPVLKSGATELVVIDD